MSESKPHTAFEQVLKASTGRNMNPNAQQLALLDAKNYLSGGVSLYPLVALALAACGGGGGGGSSPTPEPPTPTPTEPLTGRVFDGPISGAQVYFDVNANGVQDEGDVLVDTTDALGNFTISGTDLDAHGADTPLLVVLDGATDIGNDLTDASDDITLTSGTWQAPVGSTIISPLTDFLVRAEIDNARVVELLELPSDVDVTQYDPYDGDTRNDRDEAVIAAAREVARALAELDTTDPEVTPADIFYTVESSLSEPPTAFMLNSVVDTLAEGTAISTRRKVADLVVEDADTDSADHRYSLSGDDAALFEVIGAELFLKAGTVLDFETNSSLDVTVTVDDTSLTQAHTITITNVNEASTGFELENAVATLAQDVDTATRIKIADLVVDDVDTDSADHSYTVTSTNDGEDDEDLFVVEGDELFLIAGASLDATNNPTLDITVTVDGTNPPLTQTHSVTVDVSDAAPTAFELTSVVGSLTEDADTGTRTQVATLDVTDVDTDSDAQTYTVTSTNNDNDAALFVVEGAVLYLIADASLDFETNPSLDVTVTVAGTSLTATHIITITDVNEAPVIADTSTQMQTLTLNDGTTAARLANRETGYSFTATDEDGDTVTFSVDDARFAIAATGGNLLVKTNQVFDYDAAANPLGVITVTVTATDDGTGTLTDTEQVTIEITPAPELTGNPPVLTFTVSLAAPLIEGTFTSPELTDYIFTATDADGDDTVTLSVSDDRFFLAPVSSFNKSQELRVKAGAVFDYETEPRVSVTITATDNTGNTDMETVTIEITNDPADDSSPTSMFDAGALATIDVGTQSTPVFGDVDFDGDIDVLIGSANGNLRFIRADTAANSPTVWTEATIPSTPGTPLAALTTDLGGNSAPAFGDIDGDGTDDILLGFYTGTAADTDLQVFLGESSLPIWFQPFLNIPAAVTQLLTVNTETTHTRPAFGDVDGDGDDDLVIGRADGRLLFFRWGDGFGGGSGWSQQTGSNNPFNSGNLLAESGVPASDLLNLAPAFGDVDGDGDDDLLLGRSDGKLSFYRFVDDSVSTTGLQYISSNADEFVNGELNNPFKRGNDRGDNSAPSFGDIDGDGDMDLLIGEADGVLNIRYWDDETDTWVATSDVI